MSGAFSHFDPDGRARMVDVAGKPETRRRARAVAWVSMTAATLQRVKDGAIGKGDVLQVARLAGIMAAKRTPDLIPLCHPLPLASVAVDLICQDDPPGIAIEAIVSVTGRTGVEMEALTAASVAALTIYDMCKAVERGMRIGDIRLLEKSGGQSGAYEAEP